MKATEIAPILGNHKYWIALSSPRIRVGIVEGNWFLSYVPVSFGDTERDQVPSCWELA